MFETNRHACPALRPRPAEPLGRPEQGYLLPVLAVFALPSPDELRRLLVAFGLTLAVAYATYLLFPGWFERPDLRPDSAATWPLWLEYHDPSYNHFPSLHVGVNWLMCLACQRGVRFPAILLAMVLGIALSTLFVKQHYMVDVVFGMGLASLTWALAGRKLTA